MKNPPISKAGFWKCPVCLKEWTTLSRGAHRITYYPCQHEMTRKRGAQIWKPVEKKGDTK